MKIFPTLFFVVFFIGTSTQAQQITGLSEWDLFIDQGHSQTENMGLYNYSEAEKVLRVGLNLQQMILSQTDADTVYTSRRTDNDQVGLSQRSDLANNLAADFFLSLHSDAGGPDANSTLMLYGGWRENGETVEKSPKGGKRMGALMDTILTNSMRIGRRGNYADRTFYSGFPENHDRFYPYLSVNRLTDGVMASLLSEAGFHTNPFQQQRNLNSEYKKLEAQAAFWSILEYHDLERLEVGIATGRITDKENNIAINGATVEIQGQTYTTDTYQSLFNQYSSKPNELRNGFYYIENLTPGSEEIIVDSPNHYADTIQATVVDDFFTFNDVSLVSNVPPFVRLTYPEQNSTTFNPSDYLLIRFSRPMDKGSVENSISISPSVDYSTFWVQNDRIAFETDNFDFETEYTITITDEAYDASSYSHQFDGDNDGEGGGTYTLVFKTGPEDIEAPRVTAVYPFKTTIDDRLLPITVQLNEAIDTSSVNNGSIIVTDEQDVEVNGQVRAYNINERSGITFFPSDSLKPDMAYDITIKGTMKDLAGNALGTDRRADFTTSNKKVSELRAIDDFDGGLDAWWLPQQSGSTEGILTDDADRTLNDSTVNLSGNSTGAMRIDYGWDTSDASHLIRVYLNPGTSPHGVRFDDTYSVQAYVWSDGSGNQFRIMARDGSNELEGSPWYTLDWVGWKLITWNLSEDGVNAWVNGNGTFNGSGFIDSFQLTYSGGNAAEIGHVNVDDLRIVKYGTITSIGDEQNQALPTAVTLKQNFPNPFNPATNIKFGLPATSDVTLTVYNTLGQRVATLIDKPMTAGFHTVPFDASQLSSGVYLYRIQTNQQIITRKMTLIK